MFSRRLCLSAAAAGLFLPLATLAASPTVETPATGTLRFEPLPNGQFAAAGTRDRFVFSANTLRYREGAIQFVHASPNAVLHPEGKLPSTTNRIIGSDPRLWRVALPNYRTLVVSNLYRGVDLVYYGSAGELEYDVTIAAGVDPSRIQFRFAGETPVIDEKGHLSASLIHKPPVAYQIASNGKRSSVECSYRKNPDGTFAFQIGPYDHTRELIIDPVLTFGAYAAGSNGEYARAIGRDREGFLYIGGVTGSTDLALAGDTAQTASGGSTDVFIAKLDPNAPADQQVVYVTYFGGSGAETLTGMAVNDEGVVYFTGSTTSTNLPVVNAVKSTISGNSDAYLAAMDARRGTAALYFATYLGGGSDDWANGIALDSSGHVFVTGATQSTDFPTTSPYQPSSAGTADAFITGYDVNVSGASILYSTYLGGGGWDEARSIAVDANGKLWITGITYSYDFPLVNSPYQDANRTGGDAFLANLDLSAGLAYSTYFGGNGVDAALRMRIDSANRLLMTGYTTSPDLPVTQGAMRSSFAGTTDAFFAIWRIDSGGPPQLTYSSYFGGAGGEVPYDVTSDADGNVYAVGYTTSADFPIIGDALQPSIQGGLNGFLVKFNPARSGVDAIDYSSFVTSNGTQAAYGLYADDSGNVYVTGATTGDLFAGTSGASSRQTAVGNADAFIVGVNPCTISLSSASQQFPVEGGRSTVALSISRDCHWKATSPVDWVTISPSTGSAGADVIINLAPNTTGQGRQVTIKLGYATFLVGQNP